MKRILIIIALITFVGTLASQAQTTQPDQNIQKLEAVTSNDGLQPVAKN